METSKNPRETMSIRVNVLMSEIMYTPIVEPCSC